MLEEIDIAVAQLSINKCPGPDGYSMNFIRKFYPLIKHTLHSVFLKAVQQNKMFDSALQGIMSLISC